MIPAISFRPILFTFFLVCLSACSSKVVEQPVSAQQRMAFSQAALQYAYTVQKYMALCGSMSQATMAQTRMLEKQWLIDHWAKISLADSEYQAHINQLKSSVGERVALIKPIRLALDVDREQEKVIKRINNHYNNRDGRCLRVLKEHMAEFESVFSGAENQRVIAVLTSEHTKAIQPYRVLLNYQSGLSPTHVLQGKSLFKAENMAFQYCGGIDQANVVVLDQTGSAEYYGVACDNDKLAIIRCQFGQCEQSSQR